MSATLDWAEQAARTFEPPVRRFATPGELAKHCDPTTLQTAALDLIDQAAVNVLDGVTTRQQIAAPPQTGKSQRISRWTPLWMLTCDPTLRIVIVSADLELARRWGRQIKRDVLRNPDLGIRLQPDSKAAGRWETTQGGSLYCTGIGAGTTGHPIDILIVDDPIKKREQAESFVQRETVWDFWENDGGTRARAAIVMATRWHADDLPGRLQTREPGEWQVLSIPAIAEGSDDPLGREPGEEIQSANPKLHGPGYYHRLSATIADYTWSSLFQQRPAPAAGGLFKRLALRFWLHAEHSTLGRPAITCGGREVYLETMWRFLTVDLAISKRTSADYTAIGVWGITLDGDLVLLDGVRQRLGEAEHFAAVEGLRSKWDAGTVFIEASQYATTLVHEAGKSGVPIEAMQADVDKVTRALPAAARAKAGRLWLPAVAHSPWVADWVNELTGFPTGSLHDDTVDVTSHAAAVAAKHWLPMMSADQQRALETPSRELNLMTAPM